MPNPSLTKRIPIPQEVTCTVSASDMLDFLDYQCVPADVRAKAGTYISEGWWCCWSTLHYGGEEKRIRKPTDEEVVLWESLARVRRAVLG